MRVAYMVIWNKDDKDYTIDSVWIDYGEAKLQLAKKLESEKEYKYSNWTIELVSLYL